MSRSISKGAAQLSAPIPGNTPPPEDTPGFPTLAEVQASLNQPVNKRDNGLPIELFKEIMGLSGGTQ